MTKNIRLYYYFVLLFGFIFFTGQETRAQYSAKLGKLNLSQYDFTKNGNIELNGVWEFYPLKLYTPEDFKNGNPETPVFVSIPSLWDKNTFNKSKNPFIGYGTYHLQLTLPENIKFYAFKLKRIESSYKIWVNEKVVLEVGQVSDNKKENVPQQKSVTRIFEVENPKIDIFIQVSNFYHRKGGIADPILLGPTEQIVKQTKQSRGYEMFIIGVLFMMAVFHFGLYFARRKDYSLLFFGLLLLSEILSISVNGETLLTYYFPDMKWLTLKRFDYISNFFRISFFALFFYQLYKKYINKYFALSVAGINLLMTFFVLLTDLQTFAFTLFVFIAISALTLFYVLYAQIKSVVKKEEGALIPFIGTLILLLTAVNDILLVAGFLHSIYLVPIGLFLFVFAQSYSLSFNFSKLYKREEELNSLMKGIEELKNELLNNRSFELNTSLKIICEKIEADRGILLSVKDGSSENKANYHSEEIPKLKTYPSKLIEDTLTKKKTRVIHRISGNSFYEKDYSDTNSVAYALVVPFETAGEIKAIAYFEKAKTKNAFSEQDGKILEGISAQIVGLIDNFNLYFETENIRKNLERIIEARTQDVTNQRNLLENQKNEIEIINKQLNETLEEIKSKHEIIQDNIQAAQLIQAALLPDEKYFRTLFDDIFVLFKPKEIVSGDFYQVNEVLNENNQKNIIVTLADCTGHGVPGVLISLIGNDLIKNSIIKKNLRKPSQILNEIQNDITEKLFADEEDLKLKDGMDMAVINYNPDTLMLEYAGAKIDLLIFRNNKLNEVKSDRLSISAERHQKLKDRTFKNYKIQLKKGDILYLATDGYQDQFGGENDTKFMKKRFRLLLEEIGNLQFSIQRSRLLKTLNQWRGKNIQNDDITVIGIKI